MPPRKKETADTSVLDGFPSLDSRLEALRKGATKLTDRWDLPDAVSIPGEKGLQYRKRVYSTGLLSLDDVLKIGGLPRGHITELFGSPSAGKSLLLYQLIREVQHQCTVCAGQLEYFDLQKGGKAITTQQTVLVRGEEETIEIPKRSSTCKNCGREDTGGLFVLFDQENSFDPIWTTKQGIELTKLLVLKLPTGEQALDMLRMTLNQYKPDGVGIDSISQLQPQAEQERSSVDDSTMPGLHAKIMSQLCRHVTSAFLLDPKNAPVFVWVNQLRADVSGNGAIKVTGGYAPEFYSSIRIYMLKRALVNQQKAEAGTNGRITIKKCKAAGGVVNRTVDYVLLDTGFDIATDMYQTAVNKGIFNPAKLGSGQHFWADDTEFTDKLANNKPAAIERLSTDEAFAAAVRTRVLAKEQVTSVPEIYVGDFPNQEQEFVQE